MKIGDDGRVEFGNLVGGTGVGGGLLSYEQMMNKTAGAIQTTSNEQDMMDNNISGRKAFAEIAQ